MRVSTLASQVQVLFQREFGIRFFLVFWAAESPQNTKKNLIPNSRLSLLFQ